MPVQPQLVNASAVFPFDGYVIEIGDTIGGLTSVGACDGDASGNFAYTIFRYQDSGGEDLIDQIKNMTMEIAFTLSELNIDSIQQIGGGALTKETVAGTPLTNQDEVIASGDWSYDQLYILQNKNGDGSVPTINSVTGSVDGALTVDVDYFIVKNQAGKWAIYIIDSATVTTEAQSITVNSDYTPAASNSLSAGSSSVILTPKIVRFAHYESDGSTIDRSLTIFKSKLGEGGLSFAFGSAVNDGVNLMPIALTGEIDTDRADGKQLFTYLDAASA